MKRLAAIIVVALCAGAAHADPSDYCDRGVLPPSSTPAGTGLRLDSEPRRATATACTNGAAAPAGGSARLTIDANDPSVLVVADGDPGNTATGCSDGYAGARAGGGGVALYQGGDGGYTTRARPKTAQEFATDVIADCTGLRRAAPTTMGRR